MTADSAVIRPFRLDPPPQETPELPDYIPAFSYRPEMRVDPAFNAVIRSFLDKHNSRQWQLHRPARKLVLQGPPGEGKSEQAAAAASAYGCNVTRTPVARIGGETENAGTVFLQELLTGCSAISLATRMPHVVIIDDADQGIFVTRENRTYQVDTDGTNAFLQYLADTREAFVDYRGMPIPIIMTGNDFTGMRESLESRATFYTYAPTWQARAARFEEIVAPRTWRERRALRAFCRAHKHQPLRFLVQCRAAAFDEAVNKNLNRDDPPDPDDIDRAVIAACRRLDIDALYRAAKQHTAHAPRSFIRPWR